MHDGLRFKKRDTDVHTIIDDDGTQAYDNAMNEPKPTQNESASNNTFFAAFIDGMIFHNLSLVDFVGLTPIIAGGKTVADGLLLSVATTIVLLAVTPIAAKIGKKIDDRIAPALYTIMCAIVVFALMMPCYALCPDQMNSLGLLFPLIAVNGITLNRINNFSGRSILATMGDALGKGLGFAIVMFFVASCREILGYGTFFNIPVPYFQDHCTRIIAGIPGGFFFMALFAQLVREIGKLTVKRNSSDERSKL